MTGVTQILRRVSTGDPAAAGELLPLVYDELRKLAAIRLSQERAGQTLQPTALVHDVYLRLVDVDVPQQWDGRGHFFAAAAEAMRRILVEVARRKARDKHGGSRDREELRDDSLIAPHRSEELLAVDEALRTLEAKKPEAALLVKLRYFAGFSIPEAADRMGVSPRRADQIWAYARAWLAAEIGQPSAG